jgi:protein-S-isoprenylcysteine O-methyltransferase Ste14
MTTLSIISLALGLIWRVYWYVMEIRADKNKPKKNHHVIISEQGVILFLSFFVVINLVGIVWFPFHNTLVAWIGFGLVIGGFAECMAARYILADNWANSFEYQIKEHHELITRGIYHLVRHPIYGGMWLMGTGMLLVAGTYLVFLFVPLVFIGMIPLALREERLLTHTFGQQYRTYMHSSKRFIPFIY